MTGQTPEWEGDWLSLVAEDTEFRLNSRWTNVALRLIGEDFDRTYHIDHSAIGVHRPGTPAPIVTLTGSADAWTSYLSPIPRPPNHHILGMQRRRPDFTIDGRHALLVNLRVLNRVMDLLRTAAAGSRQDVA